jgi:hypothetical protein
MSQQFLPGVRLQSREPDGRPGIMANEKIDGAITKLALPVEQYDLVGG